MATSIAAGRKIVVVAALARELAPLRRGGNSSLDFVVTGEGVQNAERELALKLNEVQPRAVLGVGFGGALSASLEIGDLVVVSMIDGLIEIQPSETLLAAAQTLSMDRIKTGIAITVDEVVCEAAAKRRLAARLSIAEPAVVDMESAVIARICAERRIPFLIVRAVSDLLDEDLPVDFNRCRNEGGRISSLKVIRAAAGRPGAVKGLLELQRRSRLCADRLAEFVEEFAGVVEE